MPRQIPTKNGRKNPVQFVTALIKLFLLDRLLVYLQATIAVDEKYCFMK